MELKIEKNIPITPKGNAKWMRFFKKADVGDSILLSEKEENSLRTTAYKWGCKVVRRKTKDGKYRVWYMGKDGVGN
jgi:hypothetical protein